MLRIFITELIVIPKPNTTEHSLHNRACGLSALSRLDVQENSKWEGKSGRPGKVSRRAHCLFHITSTPRILGFKAAELHCCPHHPKAGAG